MVRSVLLDGKKFFATVPTTKAFGPNVTVWTSLPFRSIEKVTVVPGATFLFSGWKENVSALRLPGPMATTGPVALASFLMIAFTVAVWAACSAAARALRLAGVSLDLGTTRTVPVMFGWT